ncbi:MAG TPA: dihydrofolate reductase [Chitinophagaceae bacterium]|nr:dihydrofolate reductase [Chitinophagaceae bacterium]
MIISFVVAAANNNVIGRNGQLPWQLATDMKHFKNVTWGFPVIMGRKSFDSLGKALSGRKNIVITRQPDWSAEGTTVVRTLDEALAAVKAMDVKEAMIIGGGEIFKLASDRVSRIYLTRVDADPDGDAYLSSIDPGEWKMISRQDYKADARNNYAFSFQTWEKKLAN